MLHTPLHRRHVLALTAASTCGLSAQVLAQAILVNESGKVGKA